MEGLIAVLGFWVCIIAVIMKKPLMSYLEKTKSAPTEEISNLNQRVQQLESLVSTLNNQLTEINANSEFSQKLLVDCARKLSDAEHLIVAATNQTTVLIEQAQTELAKPRMIEAAPVESSFGEVINNQTVRFERLLPGSVDKAWQYFTTSEHLSSWLAAANIEARLGGRVELNFAGKEQAQRQVKGNRIIGLINSFEPGRKLGFSWMDTADDLDSAVAIELSEKGGQTSLVLTHSRLPEDRMHEFMAAWHAHLDILAARLANLVPPDFNKRFNQVVQKYAAIVAGTIVVTSTAAASLSVAAEAAAPVEQNAYQAIKSERSDLMRRYDLLWRDVDEHQRRLDLLRRDSSLEAQRQIDQLDRQLEVEYRDLHQLELDIKDLDKALR